MKRKTTLAKVISTLLTMVGGAAGAESCADILNDQQASQTPDVVLYRDLVVCRAEALVATLKRADEEPQRCAIAFDIAEKLDLSQFPSSLGPRLDGSAKMSQFSDVSINSACTEIDFSEENWERRFQLVGISAASAVLRMTDRALSASYDRPAVFLVRPDFAGGLVIEEYCDAARRLRQLNHNGCN